MSKFIAIALKVLIIVFAVRFGFSYIEKQESLSDQNILVWIFIIIPLAMGYEEIIAIVFGWILKKIEK